MGLLFSLGAWAQVGLSPIQPHHAFLSKVRHPEKTDIRKSRFTTEQIIGFIKQAALRQGRSRSGQI
jgi:hypothetical protein